jgi:hypothetical protein
VHTPGAGNASNNGETPNSPDEPNDQPANPLCGSALLVLVALGGLPLVMVSWRRDILR